MLNILYSPMFSYLAFLKGKNQICVHSRALETEQGFVCAK